MCILILYVHINVYFNSLRTPGHQICTIVLYSTPKQTRGNLSGLLRGFSLYLCLDWVCMSDLREVLIWRRCLQSLQFLLWKQPATRAQIFVDLPEKRTSLLSFLFVQPWPDRSFNWTTKTSMFILSGGTFFFHCPQVETPRQRAVSFGHNASLGTF